MLVAGRRVQPQLDLDEVHLRCLTADPDALHVGAGCHFHAGEVGEPVCGEDVLGARVNRCLNSPLCSLESPIDIAPRGGWRAEQRP